MALTTAQIGKSGELLVQYRLLLLGIESAPMNTDTGMDLVVYSPRLSQALTIQVKTNLCAKPGGGKGKAALDWWVPESVPAQFVACVDLSSERVWLFTREELTGLAQQKSSGKLHLYMYTDLNVRPRTKNRLVHSHEFDRFLISNRVATVFNLQVE